MYNVFKVNNNMKRFDMSLLEQGDNTDYTYKYLTEAVFANGRETLEPVLEKIKVVKSTLTELITTQEKSKKKADAFNPKAFWKHNCFKELENVIKETFGFRSVEIEPWIERYDTATKTFDSYEINCYTWRNIRYPVEGLVSEKGFYDHTHSLNICIRISLGLINIVEPEEVLAIILHELGHNIDPALMDIKYTQTNILAKYISDREETFTEEEDDYIKNSEINKSSAFIEVLFCMIMFLPFIIILISEIIYRLKYFFMGTEKVQEGKLKEIANMLKNDKRFNRQNNSEAFADNLPRMYGYGVPLMSAMNKMSKDWESKINSRYKLERDRADTMLEITKYCIKGVHRTDIHRIHSLIREYKADIADPNIPKEVKKQIENDLKEMEIILDSYLNDFSEMQNKINQLILKELNAKDKNAERRNKNAKDKTDVDDKEAALDNLIEDEPVIENTVQRYSLTKDEKGEVIKRYGKEMIPFITRDDEGYYARTHRARTKSYPTIDDLPKKEVRFIASTS